MGGGEGACQGRCVCMHFYKYSAKVFTFNKIYIIFEYKDSCIKQNDSQNSV